MKKMIMIAMLTMGAAIGGLSDENQPIPERIGRRSAVRQQARTNEIPTRVVKISGSEWEYVKQKIREEGEYLFRKEKVLLAVTNSLPFEIEGTFPQRETVPRSNAPERSKKRNKPNPPTLPKPYPGQNI